MPQALAAPMALLLIVIGFFWKLVLTNQYTWIGSPDIANQVVPWLNYQAQQFHAHQFPMWDPFLFGGQSLIGQGQPGLAYPLNWILFSLPLRDGHLNFDFLNWYYLSIHYFGALFCYLLCRDLGRGKFASVLAGVAFGLGGYVGTTDWPQMINGAIWGPLVFLFLFRALRGVNPLASAAFSGLFLGMSWLSGHHQIPIFLTLAAGGVWLYSMRRSLLAPTAIFLVFVVLTSALQTWPAYEYGHLALRWVGSQHDPIGWGEPVPYYVHQQYSLSPIYLLGILIPGYSDNSNPYVGVVGLTLAGLAVAWRWKIREVRILFAIGIGGLFLALAKNSVFHGILYSVVPLVEKARSPATAIYLFQFAIAVLLAFGLDAVFIPANRRILRRVALVLIGFGAAAFFILFGSLAGESLQWKMDDRVVMCAAAPIALAGLLYLASRGATGRPWLSSLLIGLLLLELGNVALYYLPAKDDKNAGAYLRSFDTTRAVAEFLKRQPLPLRVDVSRDAVEFNFGDWYGIDSMNGVLPSLPASLCNLGFGDEPVRALYGTNYTVSRKPTMDGQQEVFRDRADLIVFRNSNALPRVWTVHQAVRAMSPEAAKHYMQDSSFDLRTRTFGYAPPPQMEQCYGDTIRSFQRRTNSTIAVVDMMCRGMVIEGESDAPGWVATVDGRRAEIYEAYTVIRGVVVGPGMHTIEMRYRPMSVIGGAACTMSAFLAAFIIWFKLRRAEA